MALVYYEDFDGSCIISHLLSKADIILLSLFFPYKEPSDQRHFPLSAALPNPTHAYILLNIYLYIKYTVHKSPPPPMFFPCLEIWVTLGVNFISVNEDR